MKGYSNLFKYHYYYGTFESQAEVIQYEEEMKAEDELLLIESELR